MSRLPASSLFRIILDQKSSKRFLVATIGSFSFSIAVILATIGLMDGFELTLKKALTGANGDIKFSAKDDFFTVDNKLTQALSIPEIASYSTILQVEAFAILNEESRGVLVRGIDPTYFTDNIGLDLSNLKDGIYIGSELQKKHQLKIGDEIAFAFGSSKAKNQGAALLKSFKIEGIVTHGVYEKDLRFIYVNKDILIESLGFKRNISNFGIIKLNNFSNIEKVVQTLKHAQYEKYNFMPYWSEFDVLLDAVAVEKKSMSLILQLIVVVAILNVIGFVFYISETKAQDFFMLRALGLNNKSYRTFWYFLLGGIWSISVGIAYLLVEFLNSTILKLPFLKIPGDIYVLSHLDVILDPFDYLYVYGISLVWILVIGFITLKRLEGKTLVSGLRQEFS